MRLMYFFDKFTFNGCKSVLHDFISVIDDFYTVSLLIKQLL